MTDHTPGPWRYDPYRELPGFREPAGVDTGKGRWVVEYAGMTPHKEFEANARLIAAAPELLEALIAMEEEKSDYMTINKLGDPAKETTNKIARAAIAKATGEQS